MRDVYCSLVAMRHLALFAIATAFFAVDHIASLWWKCSKAIEGTDLKDFSCTAN